MIAFVFSGGASLGAVQVGMLAALAEAGIRADLCVGSSVGALNAAWLAANPEEPIAELARIWTGLRREHVFPTSPMQLGMAVLSRRQHLVAPDGLRRLLERSLTLRRLERARTAVAVVATDINTGEEVVLRKGDAIQALMASCGIPGVFPPVKVGGRWLVDGGVADNAAISVAVEAGAETIYVLPSGYACALQRPPGTALGMALHSLTLVIQQRLISEAERFDGTVDLRIVPPLCPLSVSPADFAHGAELISRSQAQTRVWLRKGSTMPGIAGLSFHQRHRSTRIGPPSPRRAAPAS